MCWQGNTLLDSNVPSTLSLQLKHKEIIIISLSWTEPKQNKNGCYKIRPNSLKNGIIIMKAQAYLIIKHIPELHPRTAFQS